MGNKFVNKRDWKSYNKELIVMGEFLLLIEIIEKWFEELNKTNYEKKGRPYEFLQTFVKL